MHTNPARRRKIQPAVINRSVNTNPAQQISYSSQPASSNELLSEREYQVLQALSKGLSFKEIGSKYYISSHTVARHVKKIYRVLAVHSRGEAVYEATKLGILSA